MHIRKATLFNSNCCYLLDHHGYLKFFFKATQEEIEMLQLDVLVEVVIIDFEFRGKTNRKMNRLDIIAKYFKRKNFQ